MRYLDNLKIRNKLLIILLILFIPLLFFAISVISKEVNENNELQEVSYRLEESEVLSGYIHHFQKERARILASIKMDSSFISEAVSQRIYTDNAERYLKDFFITSGRPFADLAVINELKNHRLAYDSGKLDYQDFQSFSNQVLEVFLARIDDNALGISNITVRRQLVSFVSLNAAKIYLARIRSNLMVSYYQNSFTHENYANFISFKDFYEKYINNFSKYSSSESVASLQGILNESGYKQVQYYIQSINNNPQMNLDAEKAIEVFNIFTASIEGIRKHESRVIDSIRKDVSEQSAAKKRNLGILITIIFISFTASIWLSYYIISLVSNNILTLKNVADRVAMGGTDISINIKTNDEIGQLAESFNKVVSKNISLSKVTQAIGQGNYDVAIESASEEDLLSNSIKEMKDNLQNFDLEHQRRNWIVGGVTGLNDEIAGTIELQVLVNKIVSYLCQYTNSQAGAAYIYMESGFLVPMAAYGLKSHIEDMKSFKEGEGVIGQVARDKKLQILEEVPHDYIKAETGIIEISPTNILLLPLVFSGNIVGVIELASRYQYKDREMEFFNSVSERIAIVIQTLQAHIQTQELLYETQNQAEELETQQEELRQLNSELKASEEELKVSQEELQEKNAELEEKAQLLEEQYETVNIKNKALEDAKQAIELKMNQVETISKYKSEFLANMSHELRTPLNSILILSKLLADNREENLNEKQLEHSQIIHNSGSDLLKLINEILDLSKIESGQVKLELAKVGIKDINIDNAFYELAKEKNISFEVNYASDVADFISTDKFRLEQIIRNFLSNAFKFTNKGGKIQLNIHKPSEKTSYKSKLLKNNREIVAFSVSDTGIGIPKQQQDHIFEAFQQADASTTRKYGGTGLGLTISKELASLLGGEINLESEENKGSTFTLYLPQKIVDKTEEGVYRQEIPSISKSRETISEVLEDLPDHDKKEISILIIEDDISFNNILADFSKAKNFKVNQAYNGIDGLKIARDIKPDAILLDINLPDMSGWDVLSEIRADKQLQNINVHVMSAYDMDVNEKHNINDQYLSKPVTLEMLDKAFGEIYQSAEKPAKGFLIVEDNIIENKAIAELLSTRNISSLSAYSAEEAESVITQKEIDGIILDLKLPGMNGFEWMKKIRSNKKFEQLPIIIYSGKDLSEEEEKKLKKFANTIIIKNEYSYIRLLDEVQLFLHNINKKLPYGKEFHMNLHLPEEILVDKKVLIVDDDIRNIYSLYSLLEIHGMDIVVANDGLEALDKLEKEPSIDIVLMDIMMPEMDGIEATKRIRQNSKWKDLPVIALTAKAMKGDREKCINAGASDYITKPVDNEKLLTLLRVWLYES